MVLRGGLRFTCSRQFVKLITPPARHRLDARVHRRQPVNENCEGSLCVGWPAHEDIDGGEPGFGPGVNGNMRLGQQDDSRNTPIFPETVEVAVEHSGAGVSGRQTQQVLEPDTVTEDCNIHPVQVGQDMDADCSRSGLHL